MAPALKLFASDKTVGDRSLLIVRPPETSETARRIDRLPTEVGVLLLTGCHQRDAPAAPGPFDLTIIISGGMVLWPSGFRAIEGWAGRHFPNAHQAGMRFLDRYLDDLERRYPNSTGCPSPA
jgi:hypothetical protein